MAATISDEGESWCISTGNLAVRLAESEKEVEAAQRLRFKIFYEEMAANPTAEMTARNRDFDAYDDIADHLLVIDTGKGPGGEEVVATYRLIRRAAAARMGSFYTAAEYEIGKLVSHPGEVLELGRSCVDQAYRSGSTMQLLWRGIATYVFRHGIEIMFGCASLPGGARARFLGFTCSSFQGGRVRPRVFMLGLLPGQLPRQVAQPSALAALQGFLHVGRKKTGARCSSEAVAAR